MLSFNVSKLTFGLHGLVFLFLFFKDSVSITINVKNMQ